MFHVKQKNFDIVDKILKYSLSEIILSGPDDKLKLTQNTQPAIMLIGVSIFNLLLKKNNLISKKIKYLAGHSLGEYTALVCAGSLSLEKAAYLLHEIGKAMQDAVPPGEGAMTAILGMKIEEVENEIKFWSNGEINDFEFNYEIREIYFKIEKDDQLVTLEIPLDLILFPFEVYLTQEEDDILDQIDKIRKTEFDFNEDSVKLSIRPASVGEVSIIGATQDKHNAVFEKVLLEQKPVENPMEEIEESGEKVSSQEVFESWRESTENKSPDYTIILAIIGIIAAIIIGAIIKIKKN